MKVCSKCRECKPLGEFGRRSYANPKPRARCLKCEADYGAAYRAAGRTADRAAYEAKNPHVRWVINYRSRARGYGFPPVIVPFTRAELIARYGDACYHCGGPFEHLDHFPVPVARGGSHSLDNCVPSCASCNQRAQLHAGHVAFSRNAL